MRVRIIKKPPVAIEGADLSDCEVNRVYDLSAALGTFLILGGWARLELRNRDRDGSDNNNFFGSRFQTS
jgi:hypothetical protein